MVLLIGNYASDQQQSMQRFGAMMLNGLAAADVETKLIRPEPVLGKLKSLGNFVAKWLGYIDKYLLFPRRLKNELSVRPDVVHICDHSNALYARFCRNIPVVVTCHDLLAVRGALGEQTDCPASLTGRILQRRIVAGLRKATTVVCISSATARDAARLVASENSGPGITVVELGLNYPYRKLSEAMARARLAGIDELEAGTPFVLHVGSNLRRKNRDAVMRIFAMTADKWNGQLVFAGDRLNPELASLAESLGIAGRIAQIHNPESELLEAFYNCAVALLYPSRFEGFGWPIIEAQACGCPVICSNSGPLPETAGEAGLFHEVRDEEGFARDLLRLTDPEARAQWSERSLRNAARFSTERMIARYTDIYRASGAKL